jgi:hypothetical protein
MEKGTTLTWGPGLSSDPGSGAIVAPAAIVAAATEVTAATPPPAVAAPAGAPRVVTPGWWWWQRDRGTDAPLCIAGLGASLLGPTCSPLVLLGGSETSDPSARRSLHRLSSSDTPELPRAEALLAVPLPLSKGLVAMAELALGATPMGWGTPAGTPGIQIPWRGSRPPIWRTARRCHQESTMWPGSPSSGLGHHRAP